MSNCHSFSQDLVDEKLDWMEDNPDASKDDLDDQRKEVEQIA
eukprot:CAMPEP_0113619006 /NCGR_PEP_ID=MMETSP0017_2-20120614/9642_1 /TAXON_ID=2856 /ORGANISM="Cylindrotheca closterium" /LENGTH=41 /DNA_ID=CAMNT_0000528557 /DNA_START=141 /DNA_END=263 /DNA_ORIENTATION=- /assembly_acc=CAM_ASM_000147